MRSNAPKTSRNGVRPHLENYKWSLTPFGWAFAVFAGAVTASAQTQAGPKRVDGLSYDMRMTSAPTAGAGLATAMGNVAQSYAGHATVVGNRGRLDIVEGGLQPLFSKGDYLLYDSTGITIVRPASQEYVPLSAELNNSKIFEQMQAMGVSMSVPASKGAMDR